MPDSSVRSPRAAELGAQFRAVTAVGSAGLGASRAGRLEGESDARQPRVSS